MEQSTSPSHCVLVRCTSDFLIELFVRYLMALFEPQPLYRVYLNNFLKLFSGYEVVKVRQFETR